MVICIYRLVHNIIICYHRFLALGARLWWLQCKIDTQVSVNFLHTQVIRRRNKLKHSNERSLVLPFLLPYASSLPPSFGSSTPSLQHCSTIPPHQNPKTLETAAQTIDKIEKNPKKNYFSLMGSASGSMESSGNDHKVLGLVNISKIKYWTLKLSGFLLGNRLVGNHLV